MNMTKCMVCLFFVFNTLVLKASAIESSIEYPYIKMISEQLFALVESNKLEEAADLILKNVPEEWDGDLNFGDPTFVRILFSKNNEGLTVFRKAFLLGLPDMQRMIKRYVDLARGSLRNRSNLHMFLQTIQDSVLYIASAGLIFFSIKLQTEATHL